ncbi:MAG: flagellar motor protein MotB [Planctomycetota bacterium]|jgi:chemotaxis protein MotB
MAAGNQSRVQESDTPAVAPWMMTFCDCMTLLLTFFVLLLTFSSFDDVTLDKLGGAFSNISMESIFPHKRTIQDSLIPPTEAPIDRTQEGSERPTTDEIKETENPKRMKEIFDKSAYRDRKIIKIPSDKLFYARGSSLTVNGRAHLKVLGSFIRRLPCKVIVGENNPDNYVALERAWAVLHYFTQTEKLDENQFSISTGDAVPDTNPSAREVLVIVLLLKGLYQ